MKLKKCVISCMLGIITLMGGVSACNSPKSDMEQKIYSDNIDLVNFNLERDESVDDQPYQNYCRTCAQCNEGIFYWNNECVNRLEYFDFINRVSVPVCSKPNCNHVDVDCDAVFERMFEHEADVGSTFSHDYIQVIQDNIYIVGRDSDGYVSIYCEKMDGTEFEKVMTLYRIDIPDKNSLEYTFEECWPEVVIHRGYVFFINNMDDEICIRKAKLGDKNSKIIFLNEGERANTYRLQAYGDYLFFQSGNFVDNNLTSIESNLYAYNIKNDKTICVKKGVYAHYRIANNRVYYVKDKSIYSYDMLTQEDEEVLPIEKEKLVDFYVDNNHLIINYYDGLQKNDLLDMSAKQVKTGEDTILYIHNDYMVLDVYSPEHECNQYQMCKMDELLWK